MVHFWRISRNERNDLGLSVHKHALQITKFEENGTLRGTASKRRLGDVKAFLSPLPRYSMPGGPQSLNYEQL